MQKNLCRRLSELVAASLLALAVINSPHSHWNRSRPIQFIHTSGEPLTCCWMQILPMQQQTNEAAEAIKRKKQVASGSCQSQCHCATFVRSFVRPLVRCDAQRKRDLFGAALFERHPISHTQSKLIEAGRANTLEQCPSQISFFASDAQISRRRELRHSLRSRSKQRMHENDEDIVE